MGYCRIAISKKQHKAACNCIPFQESCILQGQNDAFPFSEHFVNIFGDWPQTGRLFSLSVTEIPKDNWQIWRDTLQVQCNIETGHGKQKLYSCLMSHPAIQTVFLGFHQNEGIPKYIFRQKRCNVKLIN